MPCKYYYREKSLCLPAGIRLGKQGLARNLGIREGDALLLLREDAFYATLVSPTDEITTEEGAFKIQVVPCVSSGPEHMNEPVERAPAPDSLRLLPSMNQVQYRGPSLISRNTARSSSPYLVPLPPRGIPHRGAITPGIAQSSSYSRIWNAPVSKSVQIKLLPAKWCETRDGELKLVPDKTRRPRRFPHSGTTLSVAEALEKCNLGLDYEWVSCHTHQLCRRDGFPLDDYEDLLEIIFGAGSGRRSDIFIIERPHLEDHGRLEHDDHRLEHDDQFPANQDDETDAVQVDEGHVRDAYSQTEFNEDQWFLSILERKKQCPICLSNEVKVMCDECRNAVCTDCHNAIISTSSSCPHCRDPNFTNPTEIAMWRLNG